MDVYVAISMVGVASDPVDKVHVKSDSISTPVDTICLLIVSISTESSFFIIIFPVIAAMIIRQSTTHQINRPRFFMSHKFDNKYRYLIAPTEEINVYSRN